MKVILLQDVPGTGKKNDILNVSAGFARNYLLPRKWAMEATGAAVKEVERRNELQRQQEQERVQEAEQVAKALKGKVVVMKAKCGDKGRLYGSITAQEIAEAVQQQHGVELDRRKLEVGETIRTLGEYDIQVGLYSGIKAPMKLRIEQLT